MENETLDTARDMQGGELWRELQAPKNHDI
jgi:hypothetical protein